MEIKQQIQYVFTKEELIEKLVPKLAKFPKDKIKMYDVLDELYIIAEE